MARRKRDHKQSKGSRQNRRRARKRTRRDSENGKARPDLREESRSLETFMKAKVEQGDPIPDQVFMLGADRILYCEMREPGEPKPTWYLRLTEIVAERQPLAEFGVRDRSASEITGQAPIAAAPHNERVLQIHTTGSDRFGYIITCAYRREANRVVWHLRTESHVPDITAYTEEDSQGADSADSADTCSSKGGDERIPHRYSEDESAGVVTNAIERT